MIGLVVAPSAIAARIVEQLVLKAGCREVRSFHSATDAEAAVRTDLKPALLATEWDLPDRSGIALASAVREALDRPDFPVLLIGTRNTRDDVLEALDAGIDVYILKPIDPDVFVARATALLKEERVEEPATAAAVAPAADDPDAPGVAAGEHVATVDSGAVSAAEIATDESEAEVDSGAAPAPETAAEEPEAEVGSVAASAPEAATDEPEAAAA
jgi:DNA-binding response OmpR family regulator